jgi:type IV pilus assembly protein PilW
VVSLATYDRTNGADFEAAQPHQLRIGDTIAIQNCNGMGTAQITAITLDTPSAGTDTVTLDSTPAAELDGGTIHRYLTRRYHILNNTLALNGTELIGDSARDRIENMQILYGQDTDTDGDVDAYRIATNVTDWNQVISIKIALLLATEEFGEETDTNTYSLLGTTVDPTDDRRKRKVTTTTVQMRNRMSSI